MMIWRGENGLSSEHINTEAVRYDIQGFATRLSRMEDLFEPKYNERAS